jgi:hypothetical protein
MTDDEFLTAFEECRIPPELWTHEAHIRMAWLYLRRRPLDEVIPIVRRGITRYAESRGKTGAYHETITVGYLVLIDGRIGRGGAGGTFAEFRERHPDLLDRGLSALLEHYSREVLDSTEARATFVEPDRAPLPRRPGRTEAHPGG